ncbi:MAG: hemolysin III family protein [Alphaproteobacteria bacterium]|nr:hemolysin III family protein [Alphaproteobacteria bacterium]
MFYNYTMGERLADRISHMVGLAGSILGFVFLVLIASDYGSARVVTSFTIYGSALVISYLVSALYHDVRGSRAKAAFRVLDHASIYVLIAATYTPVALVSLGGAWGWSLFGIEWGLAAIGIALKLIYPGRYEGLSIALYLALGWAGVVALGRLITDVPWPGLALMGAGGLFFTLGTYFHARTRFRYHNVVWHGFVLAGAACHVCMTLFYIRPTP